MEAAGILRYGVNPYHDRLGIAWRCKPSPDAVILPKGEEVAVIAVGVHGATVQITFHRSSYYV